MVRIAISTIIGGFATLASAALAQSGESAVTPEGRVSGYGASASYGSPSGYGSVSSYGEASGYQVDGAGSGTASVSGHFYAGDVNWKTGRISTGGESALPDSAASRALMNTYSWTSVKSVNGGADYDPH